MVTKIEMCKKIAEIESSLEKNSSKLNELDNKMNITQEDKINERFLENRKETLKDELHELELEFLDTTWSDILQKSQKSHKDITKKIIS